MSQNRIATFFFAVFLLLLSVPSSVFAVDDAVSLGEPDGEEADKKPLGTRFSLTAGMGVLYTPNDYTYQVVEKIENGKPTASIEEKTGLGYVIEPVVMFGVYLKDEEDWKEGYRFAFQLGAQAAAAPKYWTLGLAMDHFDGYSFNAGIVYYKRNELAGGYANGQSLERKDDGSLLFTDPPTREKDALGAYLAFTFRPEIFEEFRKLLKDQ